MRANEVDAQSTTSRAWEHRRTARPLTSPRSATDCIPVSRLNDLGCEASRGMNRLACAAAAAAAVLSVVLASCSSSPKSTAPPRHPTPWRGPRRRPRPVPRPPRPTRPPRPRRLRPASLQQSAADRTGSNQLWKHREDASRHLVGWQGRVNDVQYAAPLVEVEQRSGRGQEHCEPVLNYLDRVIAPTLNLGALKQSLTSTSSGAWR
jgi:hypothetical protein